jgi:signal transduction histidine kinase
MRTGTLIPGLLAAAMSAIALYFWRAKVRLQTQLRALDENYRRAESGRKREESDRIARLEHDLKSPLGVILGFAQLLREFAEGQAEKLPALPLRCIGGIDQASRKMLQIIEGAAQTSDSESDREKSVVGEKAS